MLQICVSDLKPFSTHYNKADPRELFYSFWFAVVWYGTAALLVQGLSFVCLPVQKRLKIVLENWIFVK